MPRGFQASTFLARDEVIGPAYHANPVDEHGSLVTRDWGADLIDIAYENGRLVTTVFTTRDRNMGIDGEFLEVFVSRKAKA